MGWRYQIPYLVDLGFRVVAPNMMGYAGTVSVLSVLFSVVFQNLRCSYVDA